MASVRAEEFRSTVLTALKKAEVAPSDPFRQVLDDLAEGIGNERLHAEVVQEYGGRLSLRIAPVYRPSRAVTMLVVLLRGTHVEVLLDPRQTARNPETFTNMLKEYIQTPEFLQSLQEIAELAEQPVEGFLKSRPGTVSHRDVMLEVSPTQQQKIAESLGKEVALSLPISKFTGAGKFDPHGGYKVLESAGFAVTLAEAPVQDADGNLQISGHVSQP